MTIELKEAGLDVGERRVGGLMKINGIKPFGPANIRSQPIATTALGSLPMCWMAILLPIRPTANGQVTSAISGQPKAGSILPSFLTYIHAVSLAGRSATA